MIESIQAWDHAFFVHMNGQWVHPLLDTVMPFITNAKNTNLFLLLVALILIARFRLYGVKAIIAALIATGLADLTSSRLIKHSVGRSRPQFVMSEVRLLVPPTGSPSFPSSHASNSFAAATTLSLFFPALSVPALGLAAAVAYSRVYVGVHFPVDIFVGAVLGAVIGYVVFRIFSAMPRKKYRG